MVVPESFQLDQEILLDAGAQLHRLKMYPYFDVAHYLLMIIEVRDDLGSAASIFSRKHPLSCWLSSMLMCFADAFLANFLLGEPVIAPFKRHDDIILATIIWYLVFYAPFDGIYKIAKITPVKCVLAVMKEVKRAYKVSHGVSHAAKLYPNSYIVQVLVGTAKGAGSGIVRTLEQLVRGVWLPTHNELLRPSFATKACVVAASVLALEKSGTYLTAPHDLVYLVIVGFFVYFKLSAVILHVTDPFAPIENLFCAIFMGGIWDAVSRALAASRDRRAAGAHSNENGSSISTPEKKDQ
ncbi:Trimeric intracellular cation channel type 1B.1 [Caenorhabditis elegans]|uniref:Trimeric intracellular cation channel type 1B.1 n=1 Tax=Caenorhabditis elegans TaxID=6239 RepID=T38B1_CAEEL|nr:Trimeric intracellular cation channel type 1B.1 [Caenorhabditis elegans]Q9NA75.2 RecName: Full=Trimeric intracellular cation channel type 1B.1; Short=TRIC-1B.1; AltName: Full=TRIC-B1 [Caenorhabditis elegans]CAB55030.2 Trimeric intracellular cation channel type 1B.1 [Caenorhabditis elegans]|eukprot:NP_496603.2 Trimeric intracellular cation channel type 1B.1 [Caenorhabditis elegans]